MTYPGLLCAKTYQTPSRSAVEVIGGYLLSGQQVKKFRPR